MPRNRKSTPIMSGPVQDPVYFKLDPVPRYFYTRVFNLFYVMDRNTEDIVTVANSEATVEGYVFRLNTGMGGVPRRFKQ